MYQLESVHLVQFFLFQAQSLQLERTSAVIAPNGAGKSALLDALQIVMLGADNRHLRFNAQAGGQARARSIRDYCLGTYRPGDNGRVRDTATSYISLVFRHNTRDEVLTAGVALAASAQEPEHRLNGLYILPGVALELQDHLEMVDGEELPRTWPAFRESITRACKAKGEVPILETRSERFVRELLFRMRPAGSSGNDLNGYRKALRNALNLKNQDDIDLFVRTLVAEERPTDVARFRGLLDTFRQIKEKIDQVVQRIAEAEDVEKKYAEISRRAVRAASATALAAEYARDAHAEQIDTVESALEAANRKQQEATHQETAATLESRRLQDALEQVQAQLSGMDGYASQARFDALAAMQRGQLADIRYELQRQAGEISGALVPLTRQSPQLQPLLTFWQTWRTTLESTAPLPAPASFCPLLEQTLEHARPALADLRRQAHTLATELDDTRSRLANARSNQNRLAAGRSELRPEAARLLGYLDEAGIPARPVSDVVKVADARWQAAIEAYLGPHLDALLIAPEHEAAALALYRNLKGAQTVYGVKLALTSQARKHPPFAADDAVAAHLQGNADAVAYLARQLGKLRCAEDEESLLKSPLGLTRDGFLAKGGSIERLRLPGSAALRLGQRDNRVRHQALHEEIERLAERQQQLEQQHRQYEAPLQALAGLQAEARLIATLHQKLLKHHDLETRLASEAAQLEAGQHPDLLRLTEQRDVLRRELDAAGKQRDMAIRERALAEGELEKLQTLLTGLTAQSTTLAQQASEAFRHPDTDPNQVEKYRAELDEKYPDDLLARKHSAETRASEAQTQLHTLLRDAWPLLRQYAQTHSLPLTLESDDWRGAQSLVRDDIEQLQQTQLAQYQHEADTAYQTAVDTFRSSVAHTLHDNFVRLGNQINALNRTLRHSPAFSNNERYEFRKQVAAEYAELYRFIERAADIGETDTLFGSAGEVPAAFRDIVEEQSRGQLAQSPLDDYRRFFHFEVVIKQDDEVIGNLSERMRSGSGGEHRAPLYVIAGAALAAAYGKGDGQQDGLGLILLDEFGDKIDAQNARATTDYLRSLGLQLVVAAPDTAQGTLTGVLDSYIELFRDGPLLQTTQVNLAEAGRQIMESDQFGLHPELLAHETAKVREEMEQMASN